MKEAMPDKELPKYRSHKIVGALKIKLISPDSARAARITPEDDEFRTFETKPGYWDRFKGSDVDQGYYVRYEDGYESWSPSKAFEEGYTRVGIGEDQGQDTAKPALKEWLVRDTRGKDHVVKAEGWRIDGATLVMEVEGKPVAVFQTFEWIKLQ